MEGIHIVEVDNNTDDLFRTLVLDIQKDYTIDKAKIIDQKIFDIYGLTEAERDRIGFIDYHEKAEVCLDEE